MVDWTYNINSTDRRINRVTINVITGETTISKSILAILTVTEEIIPRIINKVTYIFFIYKILGIWLASCI